MLKTKIHIAMKREKNSGLQALKSLLIMLPILVFILAIVTFCGKTKGSEQESLQSPLKNAPAASSDVPQVEVDEMPVYPGGDEALLKYIGSNARYPEEAKKNNISGKVIVKFIVGKDGSVSGAEVIHSIDPLLDAEALRVISSLPAFEKPAQKAGKPVSVFYMVPITFALK